MTRHHRHRAFTLAELIVASIIIALIAGATTIVILRSVRARESSSARQEAFLRATAAAGFIARDLAQIAREFEPARVRVTLTQGGASASASGDARGAQDAVLALITCSRPVRTAAQGGDLTQNEGPIHEVQYRIQDGALPGAPASALALWKREDPFPDETMDAGGVATPVVDGLSGLRLEALDEAGEWTETWDSDLDGLPRAVRITASATGGAGTAQVVATARTVVSMERTPLPITLPPLPAAGAAIPTPAATPTPANPTGGGAIPRGGPGGGPGGGRGPGGGQGGGNGQGAGGRGPGGGGPGGGGQGGNGQGAGGRGPGGGGNGPGGGGSGNAPVPGGPGGGGGGGGGGGPRGRFRSRRAARSTAKLISPAPRPRAAFAIVLVVWAVGILTVLLVAIQASSMSQATAGRDALARSRAYWAARSGVEQVIAALQSETQSADGAGAQTLLSRLQSESDGVLNGATFRVVHGENGEVLPGPADAGARLNVNLMSKEDLMLLPNMSEDLADSILDYIDADEDPNPFGAEAETYSSQLFPYTPRNAPIHHLEELELVSNIQPWMVRGLDRGLDGYLDNADLEQPASPSVAASTGSADLGWSQYLTASSTSGGLAPDGLAKLDLLTAQASDIQTVTGVDADQAAAILSSAQGGTATMATFIATNLSTLAQGTAGATPGQPRRAVRNLSNDQLQALYDSCSIGPDLGGVGRLNINTANEEVFPFISGIDPVMAQLILEYRDQMGGNIPSLVSLLEIPGMSRAALAALVPRLDVRSNTFTMTAIGRDENTGVTVEMQVEVDRSALPVVMTSFRIR